MFFTFCFVFNNGYLADVAMWYWEIQPTPLTQLPKTPYKVGIVLTGITRYQKTPNDRTYFDTGADRLMHAVLLYRKGKIQKILITGGTVTAFGKVYVSEAKRLADVLALAQIPQEDIIIEEKAKNTHENALFTKEILEKMYAQDTKDISSKNTHFLVITSGFHLRRALGCFQQAGLKVDGFSAGFFTNDLRLPSLDFFVPNTRAIHLWEVLIHEIVGYLVYKLVGYA